MSKRGWDDYFTSLCYFVAKKSKDPSTKFGAIIVGPDNEIRSTGFNGLPRGIKETKERLTSPEKYGWIVHAETNAIYNAARMGLSVSGCRIYIQETPCPECTKAIIQSGIKEIITHAAWQKTPHPKWDEASAKSRQMLAEAGVKLRVFKDPISLTVVAMKNGRFVGGGESVPT